MYTLVWTTSFTRTAGKFLKQHPELREKFATVLSDLEHDPFQPHLRYHHLGGKLKNIQAISITSSYRLTLTYYFQTKKSYCLMSVVMTMYIDNRSS